MKYGKPNEITNCAGEREIEIEWDCCHSSQVLHQTHLVFFPFRHSNRHTTETLWHFVSWKYSLVCIVWLHMYCLLVARFFSGNIGDKHKVNFTNCMSRMRNCFVTPPHRERERARQWEKERIVWYESPRKQ